MGEIYYLFAFLSCALRYLKDNQSVKYYWKADFNIHNQNRNKKKCERGG